VNATEKSTNITTIKTSTSSKETNYGNKARTGTAGLSGDVKVAMLFVRTLLDDIYEEATKKAKMMRTLD